jgi:hypothetical protein
MGEVRPGQLEQHTIALALGKGRPLEKRGEQPQRPDGFVIGINDGETIRSRLDDDVSFGVSFLVFHQSSAYPGEGQSRSTPQDVEAFSRFFSEIEKVGMVNYEKHG